MHIKDGMTKKEVPEEFDQFGEYVIDQKLDKSFGDEKLLVFKAGSNTYGYQRLHSGQLKVEKIIASDRTLKLGIFPIAPIYTPEKVAEYVMLKLTTPLVLDAQSNVDAYLTMPIEIGIVKSNANDVNMIDVFSVGLQYYAIYGTPEDGMLCRYHLTRITPDIPKTAVYQEAVVRAHFVNHAGKTVTINRIVFPAKGADFYYKGAEAYYNDLHMIVSDKLGNTAAEVKFTAGNEWAAVKTSLNRNFDGRYLMEGGF